MATSGEHGPLLARLLGSSSTCTPGEGHQGDGDRAASQVRSRTARRPVISCASFSKPFNSSSVHRCSAERYGLPSESRPASPEGGHTSGGRAPKQSPHQTYPAPESTRPADLLARCEGVAVHATMTRLRKRPSHNSVVVCLIKSDVEPEGLSYHDAGLGPSIRCVSHSPRAASRRPCSQGRRRCCRTWAQAAISANGGRSTEATTRR